MPKSFDAKSYAKNVIRSAGFIATDTIKGINPNLTSFISDTAQAAKDLAHSVKDYKGTSSDFITKILGDGSVDQLKTIRKNILDDIKTGKFHNADRDEEFMNKMAKDWGFDFDFDDINFDVDEKDVDSKSSSDADTTKAVLTMGDKLAMSQAASSATSAARISAGASKNARVSMAHNERLFGRLNSSLAVINASILNLHQDLATPLNNHIVNSTNFYNAATGELAKQTSYLENINNMIANRFAPTTGFGSKKNPNERSNWDTVMGGYGLPNIGAWKDIALKRSLKKTGLDMFANLDPEMIQTMLGMVGGSPISTLATMFLTEKISGSSIGKSLNKTSDLMKRGFMKVGADIHRYNKKKNGTGLMGMLASILDIAPDEKAKLDFGKYNKGRQDWTGKDSKALQEVIPTQLAAILAAITGEEAKVYDYNTGKFITSGKVFKDFKTNREKAISDATYGMRRDIQQQFIDRDSENLRARGSNTPGYTMSSRDVVNLGKDFDKLMSLLTIRRIDVTQFTKRGDLVAFCKKMKWTGAGGMLNTKNVKEIDNIIFRNNSSYGTLVDAAFTSSVADNEFISGAGERFGTLSSTANGSNIINAHKKGKSLNSVIDDKGHDVFFYLQDYYSQLRRIANKIEGSGKAKATKQGTREQYDVEIPIDEVRLKNQELLTPRRIDSTTSTKKLNKLGSKAGREVQDSNGKYHEMSAEAAASTRASREKEEKSSPIAKAIDKVNGFLDKAFFGNCGAAIRKKIDEHGGIMGFLQDLPNIITEGATKAYEKVRNWAHDKWDQFKESDFGQDFFGATKNAIKGHFENSKKYAKEKAAKAYKWVTGKDASWAASVEAEPSGSYRGGQVRRSGMVSVSEGEMILPASLNPYYNGHMGDAARKSIERTNYRNWLKVGGSNNDFFGFYRRGGKVKKNHKHRDDGDYEIVKLSTLTKAHIKELSNEGRTPEEISDELHVNLSQVNQILQKKDLNKRDAQYARGKIIETYHKVKGSALGKGAEKILSAGLTKFQEAIAFVCGGPTEDFKANAKEALRAAKVDLPKTAATGMIGGIVGAAVTGSGLGLLGGVAVGAGVTILKNSTQLSEKLFGTYDESTKEWKGGKLPSNWTKFIKERLPKTAQAGTVGAVLGTLGLAPGGIFGGMVLGAGLELVSTTDTFKDAMFGKPDINGERHGGIVGSIKAHVVDPLANFVKDGTKKLGDYIKDNFLKPLTSVFDPIKDWAKGAAHRHLNKLFDDTKAVVKRTIGEKFEAVFKPLTSAIGKVGKGALGLAGKVLSTPFKGIQKAGEALDRHNMRMGYSSKNAKDRWQYEGKEFGVKGFIGKKLRKHYEGKEAPAFLKDKIDDMGKFHNTAYTQWAATASDDDIIKAQYFMNGQNTIKRGIANRRQNLADTITSSMANGGIDNPVVVKDLKKMFNTNKVRKDNDFSDIIATINGYDDSIMGSETKKKIIDRINSDRDKIGADRSTISDYDEQRTAFFNRIGFGDPNKMEDFIKRGQQQSRLDAAGILKARGDKSAKDIANAKSSDSVKKLMEQQTKENPLDAKRNNILESIDAKVGAIGKINGVTAQDVKDSAFKIPDDPSKVKTVADTVANTIAPRTHSTNFEDKPEAEDGAHRTVTNAEGESIAQIYKNGEWVDDINNASTNNIRQRDEEDRQTRNKFYNMFIGGGIFKSLKGLFRSKSDDDDNKKPGIIERIFGGGDGENGGGGLLGGAKDLLAGFGLGGLGRKLLSGLGGTKGILSTLGVIGLAHVAGKLGEQSAGTSTDSGMRAGMDADVRKAEVDSLHGIGGALEKSKLGFDAFENRIRGRDMTTYDQDDFISEYGTERFDERMLKNTAMAFNPKYAKTANKFIKNTVGKIPFIGKGISNIMRAPGAIITEAPKIAHNFAESRFGSKAVENMGKLAKTVKTKSTDLIAKVGTGAKNLVGGIGKKINNIAGKTAEKAPKIFAGLGKAKTGAVKAADKVSGVVSSIKKVISTVFNTLTSKLGLNATEGAMDNVVEEAAEQIAKKGGSKLAKNLSKISIILKVAFIANAVIEGAQTAKAKTILGILDEPTVGQRILSAALNGINEAIPGIGGLIPTEHLFSIIFTALQVLGWEDEGLAEQRAEAKAIVKKYNEENKTTYNIEEYIHNVLGEYTVQEKIGKTIGKAKDAVVGGVKSAWNTVTGWFGGGSSAKKNSGKAISESQFNTNYKNLNEKVLNSAALPATKIAGVDVTHTGSGSGVHTTQKGNMTKFGNTTIDQNGCGPAVASTVLKSYGKNIDINNAASYAEAGGYVAGASGMGTRASYFHDILGKNGISTSYSNNPTDIKNAVASGNPTILLGQDRKNTSKSRSPFGPNPHYVVARGTDSRGNIIVDDPELNGTALYNKSILKNTKLGVATGGDSGILDGITNVFKTIGSSLSGTAGKIFNLIFGLGKSGEEAAENSGYSDGGYTMDSYGDYGSVTYGKSPFRVATNVPSISDPNIGLYNNKSNGGISGCITGSPAAPNHNVLSNCVGWACGRFNHIYNILTGNKGIKFPQLTCNAGQFIDKAKSIGLSTGMTPQAGAIMVWTKDGGAGHVAIVERVESDDKVYTSESGYNCSTKFWNKTRTKGADGNWGAGSKYHFIGFVYNPAVTTATAATGDKLSPSESQKTIFKWLTNNGFSKIGAAGAMGCWQAESTNLADRVEGDFLQSYPGSDKVLSSRESLSDYTVNYLFPKYKKGSINKDAYKGPDGNYYAGLGLAQWTGPRAYNLIEYASKKGKSFRSTEAQLDFFKNAKGELPARGNLMSKLNGASTPEDAATAFLDGFEMYSGWHNKNSTGREQNKVRRQNARLIYNTLSTMDTSNGPKMNGTTNTSNSPNWTASGSGVPITYNFTDPKNVKKTTYFASSRGSGTRIATPTSVTTGEPSDKKIDSILLFLKQIASNTGYNAAIPALVDVMKQSAGIMTSLSNSKDPNTAQQSDMAESINNDIEVMRSKLEAIAQTL